MTIFDIIKSISNDKNYLVNVKESKESDIINSEIGFRYYNKSEDNNNFAMFNSENIKGVRIKSSFENDKLVIKNVKFNAIDFNEYNKDVDSHNKAKSLYFVETNSLITKLAQADKILSVEFVNSTLTPEITEGLKHVNDLKSISFKECNLTPEIAEGLKHFNGLKSIYFDGCDFTPEIVEEVKYLNSLKPIYFDRCESTPQVIKKLADAKALESISFRNLEVTPEVAKNLSNIKSLTSISFEDCGITQAHIEHLNAFKELKLSLSSRDSFSVFKYVDIPINEECAKAINMLNLQELSIDEASFADEKSFNEILKTRCLYDVDVNNVYINGHQISDEQKKDLSEVINVNNNARALKVIFEALSNQGSSEIEHNIDPQDNSNCCLAPALSEVFNQIFDRQLSPFIEIASDNKKKLPLLPQTAHDEIAGYIFGKDFEKDNYSRLVSNDTIPASQQFQK